MFATLNSLHDAIPINLEAFILLLDVRAQGNIIGQQENKTSVMERVFSSLRRNKNPSSSFLRRNKKKV